MRGIDPIDGRKQVAVVIVGAGPCGIGAALRLQELGVGAPDWLVIDSAETVGGLASTVTDDAGYRWDLGGHVIFSHAAEFDRLMERVVPPDGWSHVERAGWVWHRDRFVPTPFQQHYGQLPAAVAEQCRAGLRARVDAVDDSFDAWVLEEFGAGLADVFFRPFNFKMWGYPATRLDSDWVTHRSGSGAPNVPPVTDHDGGALAESFPYPVAGTGEIWTNSARLVGLEHFAMGRTLASVDLDARVLRLSSGEEISYEHLVSTVPLDVLLSRLEDRPELAGDGAGLVSSATWLVGLGVRGPVPETLACKRWMYFSDLAIPFHRATILSNYSPEMVPDPGQHWSLLCEISDTAARRADPATIERGVVASAQRLVYGWGGGDVDHVWSRRLSHGYPTPFLGRRELLPRIHSELEADGVFSRGRFGAWRYEVSNQDHAFMQGYEAIGRIVLGEGEPTLAACDSGVVRAS